MHWWGYAILIGAVLLGGGTAFYLRKNYKKILQATLSLSGAYILGITVLHLLPEVYLGQGEMIGLFVLLGFMIQLLLEFASRGIEHGHIHAAHHKTTGFVLQIMLGLCVHAFLEGMPLAGNILDHHGHGHHHHFLFGVALHKIPAAFALVLLLSLSKYSQKTVVFCWMAFALMSPLGALTAESLGNILSLEWNNRILAVVAGSFLHIATTILFEIENGKHQLSKQKMVAIIIGFGAALLTILV